MLWLHFSASGSHAGDGLQALQSNGNSRDAKVILSLRSHACALYQRAKRGCTTVACSSLPGITCASFTHKLLIAARSSASSLV